MIIIRGIALFLGGPLLLAGCATPSDRIADQLLRFGLDQRQATCVGDRLEARLSLAQLQQLASAARAYASGDPNPRQLTSADLARVSAQISDPQIPLEVAAAGASCGLLSSFLAG